jgi:hypothetical protein
MMINCRLSLPAGPINLPTGAWRTVSRGKKMSEANEIAPRLKPLFDGEYISFSPFDEIALAELIRRVARPGCRAAEIGSWLGNGSTQIFLDELRECAGAQLLCVDHWRGNDNVPRQQEVVAHYDVFATFLRNTAEHQTELIPIQKSSLDAAADVPDGTLDLVFIDAQHDYRSTSADIAAWRPKVKSGGILCGHDCEIRVDPDNRPILLEAGDSDTCKIAGVPFLEVHPGSVLAVDEAFGRTVQLFAESPVTLADGTVGRSSIWWIEI